MRTNLPWSAAVLSWALFGLPAAGLAQTVYVPITPCRIAQTSVAGGIISANTTRTFAVLGPNTNYSAQGGNAAGCGIPSLNQVQAVFFNFVAQAPQGQGNLLAWAGGGTQPTTGSTLNFQLLSPNLNVANGVAIPVRTTGVVGQDLNVRANLSSTHVVIDAVGYFTNNVNSTTGLQVTNSNATPGSHIGLQGNLDAAGVSGAGVWGETSSDVGYGVFGQSDSSTGINYGVGGISNSSDGFGVWGLNTATGRGIGVYGESDAGDGIGVQGVGTATTSYGVQGKADGATAYGGFFTSSSGVALHAEGATGAEVFGPLAVNDTGATAVAADTPVLVARTGNGLLISFETGPSTPVGSISVSGSTVSYNAFTGSHYAQTTEAIAPGMLVSMTGRNGSLHNQPGLEVLYGITLSSRANDPAVLGAYVGRQSPDLSQRPDSENPHLVAAVGNGEVWVTDTGEDLAPGDPLISAGVAGHAMKDTGQFPVSHVIARAAQAVRWKEIPSTADGVKHTRISVLFEGHSREATRELRAALQAQERRLAAQAQEIDRLRGEVAIQTALARQAAEQGEARLASLERRLRELEGGTILARATRTVERP